MSAEVGRIVARLRLAAANAESLGEWLIEQAIAARAIARDLEAGQPPAVLLESARGLFKLPKGAELVELVIGR